MEPVLHDDYNLRQIELTSVCCAKILDKKHTSNLVQKLHETHPLANLQHLKRVRCIHQELHIVLDVGDSNTLAELQKNLADMAGLGDFFITQAPSKKPLTRKQFLEAQKYWPCQFYEDKRVEQLLSGEIFTTEELVRAKEHMSLAAEEANKAALNSLTPVGAVIVNPTSGEVIAKAHTLPSHQHPLWHAVMLCIDKVAAQQGGGAWEKGVSIGDGKAVESDSEAPPTKKSRSDEYLCSGYDLYTTREPCVMCSMALVHSRIGRVFYGSSDPLSGGLGGKLKIHCQPGINHHFQVFKGLGT